MNGTHILGVMLALAGGCRTAQSAPAAPAVHPAADLTTIDADFAEGHCDEAIAAYTSALHDAKQPGDVARFQLFRALARLDCRSRQSTQAAFVELRAVERDHSKLVWGRIAKVFVDEVVREQALQQMLARSDAEVTRLSTSISSLEEEIATTRAEATEHKALLASLRAERRKLQNALTQVTEESDAQHTRVLALELELAGLKRIDMAREP